MGGYRDGRRFSPPLPYPKHQDRALADTTAHLTAATRRIAALQHEVTATAAAASAATRNAAKAKADEAAAQAHAARQNEVTKKLCAQAAIEQKRATDAARGVRTVLQSHARALVGVRAAMVQAAERRGFVAMAE